MKKFYFSLLLLGSLALHAQPPVTSPHLDLYYSLPSGRIWDFKDNRVLVQQDTVISIRHLQNNTTEVIPFTRPLKQGELSERPAWLTSAGAVFTSTMLTNDHYLDAFAWNGQQLTPLADSLFHVKVKGDYVLWYRRYRLYLHNLQNGQLDFIDEPRIYNIRETRSDVAENGLVAYASAGNSTPSWYALIKYHNGLRTEVDHPPLTSAFLDYDELHADGQYIAYVGMWLQANYLHLHNGTSETTLGIVSNGHEDPPRGCVALNNGYLAYVIQSDTEPELSELRIRNPQGNSRLLFSSSRYIEVRGVGDDGSVLFNAYPSDTSRATCYADASGYVRAISKTFFDHVYFNDSSWYLSINNQLFKLAIDTTVDPKVLPFTKQTRRNTPVDFTANDFLAHYTAPDTAIEQLRGIRLTQRPRNGTLRIKEGTGNREVGVGEHVPRNLLDSLYYTPYAGFLGNDTLRWDAYKEIGYTSNDTFVVIQVHHLLSQPPRLHGMDTIYCHTSGPQPVKILNLPHPNWNTAVRVKLDDSISLPIAADSTFSIQPAAYTTGLHKVTVTFATALDTVHTSINFRVIGSIQPAFTLTAWPNPVPAGTDTVVITATYTSRFNGMQYPQFAFAWDDQFTRLLQAEGNRHIFRLAVDRLTADSTPVYVRMKVRGDCFTDSTLTQSITITREDVSPLRLQPATSAVNGKMLNHPQDAGPVRAYPNPFSHQFTVTGLQPARTYILSLFDQEGRLLLRRKVYHQNKADVLNDLDLGKGLYLLQVYDEQEKQVTATLKLLHL